MQLRAHTIFITVLLLLGGCASSPDEQKDSKKQVLNYAKSDADYRVLVDKLLRKQTTAQDIDKLLRLYPLTSFYSPRSQIEQEVKRASEQFIQTREWIYCIRENRKVLQQNYTSMTAHYGIAVCAEEAGDTETAKFHNWVLDNFVEAIWRSGDGQSPDSAFYINSTSDLIAFIQLHQMVGIEQELIYRNKLPVQKVKVQNPENQRIYEWYFDMTPQFRKAYIDKIESEG